MLKNSTLSKLNESLFQKIKNLVQDENRIGIEILECLNEIERRKAYSELGYDSLFTYCVKELRFTESQAYHRIQAMRAVHELPEIKHMLENGTLSVSTVSKVQKHIRQKKQEGVRHTATEKLELFQKMQNHSSREVDQKIAELRGVKIQQKLYLELDEESAKLWNEVKNLSVHKTKGNDVEAFKMLMREWLKKNDPRKGAHTKDNGLSGDNMPKGATKTSYLQCTISGTFQKQGVKLPTRYIPREIRRFIWMRDQAKCTNCGSKYGLQIDHRQPFAKQADFLHDPTHTHDPKNLRLLCRSCNQAHGIRTYGVKTMRR